MLSQYRFAASIEQQFAACLQATMHTYPNVDPYQQYVRSMHLPPGIFDMYLTACMRANGFVQLDAADPRCLDIRQLEKRGLLLCGGALIHLAMLLFEDTS
jgi:hypothetical protein